MAVVMSSANTKGGTGKTSLLKHLGIIFAQQNKRVLLIDLCQNSDVAVRLGHNRYSFQYDTYSWISKQVPFDQVVQHDEATGLDFIPASGHVGKIEEYAAQSRVLYQEWVVKEAIKEIQDRYDYILIDTHPSEEGKMLAFALVASDIALIPFILDKSCLVAAKRTVKIVQSMQSQGVDLQYFMVPFAVDFAKGFGPILQRTKLELVEELNVPEIDILQSIRYSSAISRSGMNDEVLDMSNKYVRQVMEDYKVLGEQLIEYTDLISGGVLS